MNIEDIPQAERAAYPGDIQNIYQQAGQPYGPTTIGCMHWWCDIAGDRLLFYLTADLHAPDQDVDTYKTLWRPAP